MNERSAIHAYLQTWLAERGVSDLAPLEPWLSDMHYVHLDSGDFLLRAGDPARRLYLIESGLLRLFYTTSDGKERNKAFYGSGQAMGAVSAAISGSTAPFSIQALQPSVLVSTDHTQLHEVAPLYPTTSRLLIDLLGQAFIRNERREAMLLTLSAEQRYRWLQDNEPELLAQLPQFHIASYLGVDAVSLSRIRRKLRDEGQSVPPAAGSH